MKRPGHIFFDLDHTLWDYEANAGLTIRELLEAFAGPIGRQLCFEEFYAVYHHHNQLLWTQYRQDEIDNHILRYERWRLAFADLGVEEGKWMQDISRQFLETCPRKPALMPNALAILDAIFPHYPMHIITNGFAPIQDLKLDHSGLRRFFKEIVTPDRSGFKKPHPQIFLDALDAAGCKPEDALYIGDSHAEDMVGGSNLGMEVVFYNPQGKANPGGFREIRDLMELAGLLELG
ncbi:MAG: hypothetical protein RLZZ165_843 [Bacteroidota bacterium]